ncbi:MAG: hypothetical protein H7Y28_12330 [Rhodoferax sp.]|nr:hypothetical protein [Rhodoferax sp.]
MVTAKKKPASSVAAKPATLPPKNAAVSKTASAPAKKVTTPIVKSTPSPKVAKPAAPVKEKKLKLVRDSFTIPKPEFAVLDVLKLRATKQGAPVKKTELLRAGIKALAAMSDAQLLAAVRAVPSLKTGRPAKTK